MKKIKKILAFSFLILLFASCKKNTSSPIPPALAITGISPDTAAFATTVTISGTGFNSIAADNSVTFNNVAAVVQSATSTQIVVAVPKGAGSGPVTVQTGSKTSNGFGFTYQFTYIVSTLAGGTAGFANGSGSAAQFDGPAGVATDAQGNIYVADAGNNSIRKITAAGVVTTLAGNGTAGFADGNGSAAQFNGPQGLTTDAQGNIYIADTYNISIRKITPVGVVSTLAIAGNNFVAFPAGIVIDTQGNIYYSEAGQSDSIRKITPAGVISAFAFLGQNSHSIGLALDAQGNIYVPDEGNQAIEKISPAGLVSTLAGSGVRGFMDGNGTAAQFNQPSGVATDAQGNIYVADASNNSIRKITAAGVVTTLAGNGTPGSVDGAPSVAQFNGPAGVAVDAHGNIYVADRFSNSIRMITPQ